ncbi:MAG: ABC transporter substrate-binding protein [Spirochaetota bacterium]
MHHRLGRLLAVATIMLLFVGLPVFAGGQDEAQPEGPVDIVVWGWPAADVAFESIIEGFNELYPDINVIWEMSETAAVHDSLTAAIAAGTGAPDISMIEINYIDQFALFGGLTDLLQEPFDAGRYEDQFVEYKWEQATTLEGDQLVAFPWDIGPATVFYRRDLFDAAGVPSDPESVAELLSTWEGYVETGRLVNDPDNNVYWTDQAGNIPYIYHSHKNLFDEELNVAIDNPDTRAALEIAKILRNEGMDLNVDFWTEEWYSALNEGRVATTIVGSWFGGFLKSWIAADTAGNWGIAPVPEHPLQNWGGSFLAIPEQSDNKEAAWAFIEYSMASAEPQNAIFEAVDYFPAYKPAWEDDLYETGDPFFGGQPTRALWTEIATAQGKFITTPLDAAAEAAFTAEVTTFLEQNLTVDEAIARAERAIIEQIGQDREMLRQRMGN